MTRGIRVKNTDDIQKINKIVTKYGFDIWIHGKSGMVDAKSLLGMFLLSPSARGFCPRALPDAWLPKSAGHFRRAPSMKSMASGDI